MLVSLIIPTFNRAATIGAAVESALAQTGVDREVIVVDDGSTDDTPAVLARYGGAIKVVVQRNAGPSAARNRGVAASQGGIVAFLDSDDIWLPEKTARQVALMEKAGGRMCCCVCNARIIGFSGEPAGTSFGHAGLDPAMDEGRWENPGEVLASRFLLFNQVVAVRRPAFDGVGGFNPELRILEDYELAIKLCGAGSWGVIREPLIVKRNDTDGIGVQCMTDRRAHAEVATRVMEGIVAADFGLDPRTKRELRRSLGELRWGLRAERAIACPTLTGRVAGHVLETLLRVRRGLRRRSPWHPAPRIMPVETFSKTDHDE